MLGTYLPSADLPLASQITSYLEAFLKSGDLMCSLLTPLNEPADFTMIYRLTAMGKVGYNYVRSGEHLSNMLQNQNTAQLLLIPRRC